MLFDARARSIATILLGAALLFLGYGLMLTVLPVRAQLEGFTETTIGFMGSAYFFGFTAGCLVGPRVVKAVGHARAFAGFAAMIAALTLLYPLLVDAWLWVVLRAVGGICTSVVYMVIESWLNEQATNKIRGKVLSLYIIIGNLTTIAGQQMLVIYPENGLAVFSLVAVLIAVSLVPVSLTPVKEPDPIPTAKLRIARLYSLSPTGFVGCILFGLADGAFWTFGPVFAQDRGLSVADIALFMGAFMAGGTVLQWPVGWLSDRTDRRFVIALCAALSVGSGLGLAFWDAPHPSLGFALAILHGGVMFPIYALCIAHSNDFAPNGEMVEVSSGLLLLYGGGAALGPIILGPVMEHWGAGSLFVMIAGTLGVLALFALYRAMLHRVAGEDTRVHFAPVPRSTQSVYTLETDDEDEEDSGAPERPEITG